MTPRLKVCKSVQPEVGRTNMMQTGGQELEDEDDTVSEDKSVQKRAARPRGWKGKYYAELRTRMTQRTKVYKSVQPEVCPG